MVPVMLRAAGLAFRCVRAVVPDQPLRRLAAIPARSIHRSAPARVALGAVDRLDRVLDREHELETRLSLTTLRNQLRAWGLFQQGRRLSAHQSDPAQIASAIRATHGDDAPWLLEGMGYALGEAVAGVPDETRIPLTTGAGLRLAEHLLARTPPSAIGAAIPEFSARCRRLGGPLGDLLFEGLGLMTVCFYPHHSTAVLAVLPTGTRDHDLFLHGIGRGSCFAPTDFPPFSAGEAHALESCRRLGGPAITGLSWAWTLVHMRNPEVVVSRLSEISVNDRDAVISGISAALAFWRLIQPGDPRPPAFAARLSIPLTPVGTGTVSSLFCAGSPNG